MDRHPLEDLVERFHLRLPPQLEALYRALPEGGDFGTVRLLAPEEVLSALEAPGELTASLLPVAVGQGGAGGDGFALFVPPEPAARVAAVCAVNPQSGVYAPLAQTVRGFGAWILLVRQAQAGIAAESGDAALREALEESAGAAFALARALGLEALLGRALAPDADALATALLEVEPASPWALSWLASRETGAEALRRLAPALAGAPFAAGLLEQTADILLSAGDLTRAVRSIAAALARLEPNLQAAPYRLDEPDPETGAVFEPFQPAAAYGFLMEHAAELPRDAFGAAPLAFLAQALGPAAGPGGGLCGGAGLRLAPARSAAALSAGEVIEWARRRGLGGDLPGGRWALHLAWAECRGAPEARAALAQELARDWALAGSPWYAARFASLAARAGQPG